MAQIPQRQIAKICTISELLTGTYVVCEGWKPNYVETTVLHRKLSRINIIGFIVDKPTPYQLLVDDGTGTISVIDFASQEQTLRLKVGEPVLVIGRPRQAEKEIFIAAEIATSDQLKQKPSWMTYRKKELQEIKADVINETEDAPEEIEDESDEVVVTVASVPEEKITSSEEIELTGDVVFDFVKSKGEEGCDIELIVEKFGQEADDVILTLISMGEVYEAKPGRLKVLE